MQKTYSSENEEVTVINICHNRLQHGFKSSLHLQIPLIFHLLYIKIYTINSKLEIKKKRTVFGFHVKHVNATIDNSQYHRQSANNWFSTPYMLSALMPWSKIKR